MHNNYSITCTLHMHVMIIVTQYNVGYIVLHDSYAKTHVGSQCVLIWYTHLIAAAGTQPHSSFSLPLPHPLMNHLPLLHNQVVSYHPVRTNKNSRSLDVGIMTCTQVQEWI